MLSAKMGFKPDKLFGEEYLCGDFCARDVIAIARVSLFETRLPENIEVMGHSSAAVRLQAADVASDNPFESEDLISEAWTPEWLRWCV